MYFVGIMSNCIYMVWACWSSNLLSINIIDDSILHVALVAENSRVIIVSFLFFFLVFFLACLFFSSSMIKCALHAMNINVYYSHVLYYCTNITCCLHRENSNSKRSQETNWILVYVTIIECLFGAHLHFGTTLIEFTFHMVIDVKI